MKNITIMLIFISVLIHAKTIFSQSGDIGIDFKKKGYLRDINYKTNKVLIDFVDDKHIVTEISQMPQNAGITNLRPGMEVYAEGEYFRKTKQSLIKKISANKDYSNKVKIKKGRIDGIENDYAFIDGFKVRLKNGTIIKGTNGYDKQFHALNELLLGDLVELKGQYNTDDGFVYTNSLSVEPDIDTDDDLEAKSYLTKAHDLLYEAWKHKARRKKYYGCQFDGNIISDNDDLQEYVNKVGLKLIPEHIKSKIPFVFIVINDDSFNAGCYPNGLSVVNTGLFKYVKNEAQLAAVLGHEIAHAVYEHGARRNSDVRNALKKKESLNKANNIYDIVGNVIPGSSNSQYPGNNVRIESGTTKRLLKDLPASIISKQLSNYSVEEESQADRVGLYLLVRAGYDPREASLVWKNVFNKYGNGKAKTDSYVDNTINDISDIRNPNTSGIINASINSILATKAGNNLKQARQTHPYNVKRYGDLLDKTYLFWSSESILKNSTRGLIFK